MEIVVTKVFREMVQHDAAGGVLLICAALLALIMANSGINMFYSDFLNMPVVLQLGGFEIAKPLLLWINDGLMALFFFLIGLEVKREILEGHLSSKDQIILPGIAAIAGIVAPALVYVFFNTGDEVGLRGWAIPSATDIAFALGLFSLFGKSLPLTLKLFLLSVAIFDDIGAIVIIALFYSADLSGLSLSVAGFGLVGLFILNRLKVRAQAAYIIIGVVVWAVVLKSGVHATLAGFIVAWFIPLNVKTEHGHSMLKQMEHGIQPWVAFFILPVFAFANAGVNLVGIGVEDLFHPVTMGIALGLFVGKQIGIFGVCWLAIKSGITSLPKGTTWLQLYGVCILCGIGFTMSLFIGSLAFEGMDAAYQESVKLGVLLGSLLSAVMGSIVIVKSREQEVPDLRAQQSYS
ncbi:sodium:proton antiporter [Oleiphilus sp. HI0009]|nr:sodium:proton antiporter [Oleiphilus sp. HI0009]KZY65365.1 sodium:proton antiporter [Oleiphilus sp. HI0066]KZY68414.1 sodium:proton antiporter [Oleiphilus sp. HI0067]